jgi:hypothetical protein
MINPSLLKGKYKMKPIESYPDKKHCELCGALKTDEGIDPYPDRSAAEVIRKLAFIAETSPVLAVLLIHHIAGKSEREIAKSMHRSQPTIHEKITKAKRTILSLQNT